MYTKTHLQDINSPAHYYRPVINPSAGSLVNNTVQFGRELRKWPTLDTSGMITDLSGKNYVSHSSPGWHCGLANKKGTSPTLEES